jgi:predicted O-methyltransferase YrrM
MNSPSPARAHGPLALRPRHIFSLLEQRFPDENVMFQSVMPPTGIGSMTLLEGAILASLIRLLEAKNIFEFGTFQGHGSVLLAVNSAPEARIVTLDFDPAARPAAADHAPAASTANDSFLRDVHAAGGAPCIARAAPALQRKITQIACDSHTLDLDAHDLRKRFDLIFIDGGHDAATVRNDTRKAFDMACDGAAIVWHDYGSAVHSDVTDYVDELSATLPLVHVEATMLVLYWPALNTALAHTGAK